MTWGPDIRIFPVRYISKNECTYRRFLNLSTVVFTDDIYS